MFGFWVCCCCCLWGGLVCGSGFCCFICLWLGVWLGEGVVLRDLFGLLVCVWCWVAGVIGLVWVIGL